MGFSAVYGLITELIRAANHISKLTRPEQARLLVRAASTISDCQIQIAFSLMSANGSRPDDVVHDLNEMARLIDLFASDEVAAAMLNAVETIKDCRVILDAKQETGVGS